jgi:hypothetical protein
MTSTYPRTQTVSTSTSTNKQDSQSHHTQYSHDSQTWSPSHDAHSSHKGGKGKPTHDEVARKAYEIYEKEGHPQGRDVQHWLRAESQLSA